MTEQAVQVSKQLHDKALAVHRAILKLSTDHGNRAKELGYLIVEVQKKEIWRILGHESETEYRLKLNVGRSTWYRTGRLIAGALDSKIAKQWVMRMTLENLEHLLKLESKDRNHPKWLKLAVEKNEQEFIDLVNQALGIEPGETEDEGQEPEKGIVLEIHCVNKEQRAIILETIKSFNQKEGLPPDATARGLELLLAEYWGGKPSMVAAIRKVVIPHLREAHDVLAKSEKSADEVREQAADTLGKAITALVEASTAASKARGAAA